MDGDNDTDRTLLFDPESGVSLSVHITTAVAEEKDVSVTDLAPLRDAIDIEGVCSVVDSVRQNPDGCARVSFSFEGYLVTVTSDGRIELTALA